MKIMTILGTRPEIIRLSLVIGKLDKYCDHVLVHTGQNYDHGLNGVFFKDLGLRRPDHHLEVKGKSFGVQIGKLFVESEKILRKSRPDRVLILGDTNSGLVSIVAKRLGIPVFHMEAGNRCFDDRVPEEVNRRIIDHSSTILLPYTRNSRENLLKEGIPSNRIYVTGNPINEVIESFTPQIEASDILKRLGLSRRKYFLVTIHREENVDDRDRLSNLLAALHGIQRRYKIPVVCSLHPRTKNRIRRFGLDVRNKNLIFQAPLGFFDFITLEKMALCVITDSGTVQEECCLFRVSNVTVRDVTERPETIEVGSNLLTGNRPADILRAVDATLLETREWSVPDEYQAENVSSTVLRILLGFSNAAAHP
ncbi:non-hydrolyzing UDP-N-acetylglucosamine 2-epimerase [Elusimicrobiota bacterium]